MEKPDNKKEPQLRLINKSDIQEYKFPGESCITYEFTNEEGIYRKITIPFGSNVPGEMVDFDRYIDDLAWEEARFEFKILSKINEDIIK
jgi:hypothetical protein